VSLKELISNYIRNSDKVLAEIKLVTDVVVIDEQKIMSIIESAKQYLDDAKYYEKQDKLETSLVSVSYCEGLLDALRLLGVVEFSWPSVREK
jgi:FAD synthetase